MESYLICARAMCKFQYSKNKTMLLLSKIKNLFSSLFDYLNMNEIVFKKQIFIFISSSFSLSFFLLPNSYINLTIYTFEIEITSKKNTK